MVRASERLRVAASPYVAVRVTDMRQVDVEAIQFDFDLTMAVVLMHPDGTIYHRYGTRGADDPTAWTTLEGLGALLDATLPEHRAHDATAGDRALPAWTPALERPALRQLFAGKERPECVHCHSIHDATARLRMTDGSWRDDDKWVHPEPGHIGLTMDAADQARIAAVAAASPADLAGLRAGDRLLRLGRQPVVLTIADAQWALHGLDPGATTVDATFRRGDEAMTATLELPSGWKRCSPADYAWRPYKWNLSPAPGFGGPQLSAEELARLGLGPDAFAFRVQYLVTWGPRAHRGRAAAAAGLRKDDVVVAFGGRSDFESVAHLHAWVRLEQQPGDLVTVEVLRAGERHRLEYRLPR